MTESQQSKRGWFSSWREHRRATRQESIERAIFKDEQASEAGVPRMSSAYRHSGSATFFGGFGGGDGGGCGGDGGGGGGC